MAVSKLHFSEQQFSNSISRVQFSFFFPQIIRFQNIKNLLILSIFETKKFYLLKRDKTNLFSDRKDETS